VMGLAITDYDTVAVAGQRDDDDGHE
jgi:hypothetical protein